MKVKKKQAKKKAKCLWDQIQESGEFDLTLASSGGHYYDIACTGPCPTSEAEPSDRDPYDCGLWLEQDGDKINLGKAQAIQLRDKLIELLK